MNKKLKPLNDQVVLKLKEEEKPKGNIIIPDIGQEKPILAEVIETGPGVFNFHKGLFVEFELLSDVKKGDIVILPKMGAQVTSLNGDEYYICQVGQLLAIVENE